MSEKPFYLPMWRLEMRFLDKYDAAYLHYYEHDLKSSEAEFKKALELKASYSTAHQ